MARMSLANRIPAARRAHVRVGADRTPDPADVRAEVARGRVLVRVQLPSEYAVGP